MTRLTKEEFRADIADVDNLLSRVVEHAEGLLMLIDNGDDPSHAISILVANSRFAREEFRRQYKRTTRPSGYPATWPYTTGSGGTGAVCSDASEHGFDSRGSGLVDGHCPCCQAREG